MVLCRHEVMVSNNTQTGQENMLMRPNPDVTVCMSQQKSKLIRPSYISSGLQPSSFCPRQPLISVLGRREQSVVLWCCSQSASMFNMFILRCLSAHRSCVTELRNCELLEHFCQLRRDHSPLTPLIVSIQLDFLVYAPSWVKAECLQLSVKLYKCA